MQIWSILTKKTPFEPGKKPIRLFLYVDDDKSGRGVARAGGRSGRGVARAGWPDDPPEPEFDIYGLWVCANHRPLFGSEFWIRLRTLVALMESIPLSRDRLFSFGNIFDVFFMLVDQLQKIRHQNMAANMA